MNNTKQMKKFLALAIVLSVVLPIGANNARAAGASLYLSPTSGSFVVGDVFTVSVYLNTNGQSVNAVEANLSFPANKLQVVSPTSGKSFVQVWVTQPTYSNSNGTLRFAGTVPTPGINTSAGLVSTVTFRVMDTGTAVVKFNDDSRVLLNDGRGTDVLGQTTDGIYYLVLPPPAGPIVTSPTNPDQEKWYSEKTVVLRWAASSDVQGFSYIMNDSPVDVIDDISEGTQTDVSYKNLSDGIHYFHIKAMRNGDWGGTTNYAVRIDATPPAAFSVNISPSDQTTNHDPIINFVTTDAESGIDHYELKYISLDPPAAQAGQDNKPFFIEATSPYSRNLDLGSYDVVVRAYDAAGNFYQATQRLEIINPLFQVIADRGLRIGGAYTVPWPYVGITAILIISLLAYVMIMLWKLHLNVERHLERGAEYHPEIAGKLAELKEKQKTLGAILLLLWLSGGMFMFHHSASAAMVAERQSLLPSPPIINLAPSSISNSEVLYLGGWANVPNANVIIYIEQIETGNTFSGAATTGADGSWFYSFPQLLDPGHYAAWAELKSADQLSAPSGRVTVTVAPTALQIGNSRLSYEELYLILFVAFLVIVFILIVLIAYRAYRLRLKKKKLAEAIRGAEESIRRGFSVLRRDIELGLAAIQNLKEKGPLQEDERKREEKLLQDLREVNEYIGRDIWKVEEAEKKL